MTRPRPIAVRAVAVLLGAVLCLGAMPVRADEAGDIDRLLRSGRTDEALARIDRALAAKPGDPQMRFLHGVALADAKRTDEATEVLVRLTEDYPELAEPYNNLAVLYAATGAYDKARNALEAAVRNNPGYATAYENLGDVYARLAAASYSRVQQLDAANRSAGSKLAQLRGVFAPAGASPGRAASASAR